MPYYSIIPRKIVFRVAFSRKTLQVRSKLRLSQQPAKPAVNPYQQNGHTNAQSKLRPLYFIHTLNQKFHVHSILSYLYTDPYYIRITLIN